MSGFTSRSPQNFANRLPRLGIASLRFRFATSAHGDPSRPSRADSAQKRVVFFDSAHFAFRRHAPITTRPQCKASSLQPRHASMLWARLTTTK